MFQKSNATAAWLERSVIAEWLQKTFPDLSAKIKEGEHWKVRGLGAVEAAACVDPLLFVGSEYNDVLAQFAKQTVKSIAESLKVSVHELIRPDFESDPSIDRLHEYALAALPKVIETRRATTNEGIAREAYGIARCMVNAGDQLEKELRK